jgi:thiamine biosynthesis lipoprotein
MGANRQLCPAVASRPLRPDHEQQTRKRSSHVRHFEGLPARGRSRHHASTDGGWMRRDEAIMGTAIASSCGATTRSGRVGDRCGDGEMHRIDRAMSPHKPTRSSRASTATPATRRAAQRRDVALLDARIDFSQLSAARSTSPTRRRPPLRLPRARPAERRALAARAPRRLAQPAARLRAAHVRFARRGMRIDLGGFAKGHAVDNARDPAPPRHPPRDRQRRRRQPRDRRPARPALDDRRPRPAPRRRGRRVLPLEDVAISTSGDYERFFDADGVRCHHLIDPRTGKSPRSVHSVTILADDGLTTEALSKSVFVLGVEQGMR